MARDEDSDLKASKEPRLVFRPGMNVETLTPPRISLIPALRHVRLAYPDTTEEERRAILLDAMRQMRIEFWYPAGIGMERRDEENGNVTLHVRDFNDFLSQVVFSEPSLIRAFRSAITDIRRRAGRPSLPEGLLLDELRRRAEDGKLHADSWSKDAGDLHKWLADNHPEITAKPAGIRNNRALSAEHAKLTGRAR